MTPRAREAASVLGQFIQLGRHDRGWTIQELADRTGLSYTTVKNIESGEPAVSIGNVFNVAVAVGVPLLGADEADDLTSLRRRGEERLALIPQRVREVKLPDADLDF
jgi:transcriptional regulator with XRE-family HTH domain